MLITTAYWSLWSSLGLTRDQAAALLDAADTDSGPQAARTTALAATLLFTGARVSELLGADIEDLGTDRGHRVLRVRRKDGKLQSLALPAPAAERIEAYLAGRDDVTTLPAIPGGAAAAGRRRVLFATGTGARMYRAEVRTLLRRLGRAADLPEDLAGSLSPHSIRHAFATLNQFGRRRQPARPSGRHGPRLAAHYPPVRPQPQQPGSVSRIPAGRIHQPGWLSRLRYQANTAHHDPASYGPTVTGPAR